MSLPNRVYFNMVFPQLVEPVSLFWRLLAEYLTLVDSLPETFIFSGIAGQLPLEAKAKVSPDLVLTAFEIESLIAERSLRGFGAHTGYSESSVGFELSELWDGEDFRERCSGFKCRIGQKAKSPDNWSILCDILLTRWPSIGAWQYLISYQAWQWDSLKSDFYEFRNGTFPPGYRTYPEPNFCGPFEPRIFIDISKNPGRCKELIPGVNFYPTAEMWLGPHFWQYAKCTKEDALAADFFIEKRDTPNYLYLRCWPTAFTRPDGEQGRMQQRLWKLFFHEDCEWPPGSGTICDEPMYGPAALLPVDQSNTKQI
ncbi:hypothetical protein JIN84_00325 [Luteolibacter yonseiensis]|uniref:Uncharacterized protein n=1 Tax=Luteolibacter yonseiensis TaxID=1144680 RepID=A0A934R051_9BACT|nr:hypothetical protein [Luteolibacter yonseiensis]MBK1814052.1 hypothetical protein [Luteolibacter yonseiensis]